MTLDLADYERKAATAIQQFWGSREDARQKQQQSRMISGRPIGKALLANNRVLLWPG